MKKLRALFLIPLLAVLVAPVSASAASQTKILKPTSATLGTTKLYFDGSPTPANVIGGGGTDLNNALTEDGQFALLDPELPGPGTQSPSPESILFVDYEKDQICSAATIQSVKVHVIWKGSAESTTQNDIAVLMKVSDGSSNPNFSVNVDTSNGDFTISNQVFGGLASPGGLDGGTFSGNVPTTLTHDSSDVQTIPTLADLSDPDARIVIGMGDGFIPEGEDEPAYITGSLDHTYLEVAYDDSSCSPDGIDPSTLSSPKTGSVLTVGIIVAGVLAAVLGSIFGVKRTKLKHRVSERE